jgi:cell division protein FtsW (lipid II flippase)
MKRLLRILIKLVILGALDLIILALFWFGILRLFWYDFNLSQQIGSWVIIGILIIFCDNFVLDAAKVEKAKDEVS